MPQNFPDYTDTERFYPNTGMQPPGFGNRPQNMNQGGGLLDQTDRNRQRLRGMSPSEFIQTDPRERLRLMGFQGTTIEEGLGYVDPYDEYDEETMQRQAALMQEQRQQNVQQGLLGLLSRGNVGRQRGGFAMQGQLGAELGREAENISKSFRTEANLRRLGLLQGIRDLRKQYREQFFNQAGDYYRSLKG